MGTSSAFLTPSLLLPSKSQEVCAHIGCCFQVLKLGERPVLLLWAVKSLKTKGVIPRCDVESAQSLLGADLKGPLENLCVWWLQKWKPQLVFSSTGYLSWWCLVSLLGQLMAVFSSSCVGPGLNRRYWVMVDPHCGRNLDQKAAKTCC